jgi:glycosyltransferase involved in cell wall biosynthesis
MHIAIDATPLETGHEARGIGIYTKLLIEALQKHNAKHSYSLFTRTQKVHKNADLIHYPYFDPYFLTLPLFHSKPIIVTVHDVIPLVFPDKFPAGMKGTIRGLVQKMAIQRAARIITDSKQSKSDVHRILGIDDKKIDVVYLAASPAYKPLKNKDMLADIVKKYELKNKRYIVYVGDVNWNKNVPGLLQAFSHIAVNPLWKDLHLMLVGKSFLNTTLGEVKDINHHVSRLALESRVILPGYVPEDELAGLYTLAEGLVQPSFYEGFGLPLLEAMACGCRVVAADNSSLGEIAGPSIRVNALDPSDIQRGIEELLTSSDAKRKKVIAEGLDWITSFTWQKVAKETVTSYEKVVSGI